MNLRSEHVVTALRVSPYCGKFLSEFGGASRAKKPPKIRRRAPKSRIVLIFENRTPRSPPFAERTNREERRGGSVNFGGQNRRSRRREEQRKPRAEPFTARYETENRRNNEKNEEYGTESTRRRRPLQTRAYNAHTRAHVHATTTTTDVATNQTPASGALRCAALRRPPYPCAKYTCIMATLLSCLFRRVLRLSRVLTDAIGLTPSYSFARVSPPPPPRSFSRPFCSTTRWWLFRAQKLQIKIT